MTLDIAITQKHADFRLSIETQIAEHEICGITGASGAGKTTLLRSICGLERCAGSIRLAGVALQGLAQHQRRVAYVPQNDSLLPHLSVQRNLDYAAKRAGPEVFSTHGVAAMLGITDLLARKPNSLSGGESRRAAIARALYAQPRLLLLDEPLTGLHASARNLILSSLRTLQQNTGISILWVSHDIHELTQIADSLLLLRNGELISQGPVADVLTRAETDFGRSTGSMWVCEVLEKGRSLTRLQAGKIELRLPTQNELQFTNAVGRIHISADTVSIALSAAADSSILNIIPATVQRIAEPDRARQLVTLATEAGPLLARLSEYSVQALRLKPGMSVYAQIKGVSLIQ